MRKHLSAKRALMVAPVVLVALAMSGCASQFTGGGWIPSSTGGTNANFGFTYKVTNTSTGAGQLSGSYADRDASGTPVVKFSFDGAASPASGGPDSCIDTLFNYRSTNPARPGTGQGELTACDNGQSGGPQPNSLDNVSISISSGPYSGYYNSGDLQGGNLSSHK